MFFVDPSDPRRPRNLDRLKCIVQQVMIRNRRSRLPLRLPARSAYSLAVSLSAAEETFQRQIVELVRERAFWTTERRGARAMTQVLLQKEACSSTFAAVETLGHLASSPRISEEQRRRLLALRDQGAGIGENAKEQKVRQVAEKCSERILVYTEFRATQEHLARYLRNAGHEVILYHGGMSGTERDEAVVRFREAKSSIMISTESGAEGRNLQFCNILLNYDLPWNPMRLEQRIGRLHRLGQPREVLVGNLVARRTLEEYVFEVLASKIRMFELVVGELDLILGDIGGGESFEQKLARMWVESKDDSEFARNLDAYAEQISEARRRFEQIKGAERIVSDLFE